MGQHVCASHLLGPLRLTVARRTVGYGVGSSLHHIGPEYGFSFAMDEALQEDVLVIKWAFGGTTISGNWRPPSSTLNNKTAAAGVVGPLYLKMVNGTREILKNLPHYFPEYADRQQFDFLGFGWFLGWNDGCGQASTDEYEFNMVSHLLPKLLPNLLPNIHAVVLSGEHDQGRSARVRQPKDGDLHPCLGLRRLDADVTPAAGDHQGAVRCGECHPTP